MDSKDQMSVDEFRDIHKIMTHLYNVDLNSFIAKYADTRKINDVVQTGGLMEIRRADKSPLQSCAEWLELYRTRIFDKSSNFFLEDKAFKDQIETLIEFYISLNVVQYSNPEVKKELIEPLEIFFTELDESLKTDYFKKRLEYLAKTQPVLQVKLINFFNAFPVAAKKMELRYLMAPEFGNYSKTIIIGEKETSPDGEISAKLGKGTYQILLDNKVKVKKNCLDKDRKL